MDLVTLDVSSVPPEDCQVGDFAELIGAHLGVDDVAERAGTNGYEILTSLGHRYVSSRFDPRVILEGVRGRALFEEVMRVTGGDAPTLRARKECGVSGSPRPPRR